MTSEIAAEYKYNIRANDTYNNFNESLSYEFDLPLNEDVNLSSKIHYLDLIAVSLCYNDIGPDGWSREDFNNDGMVHFMDLVQVSLAYK
jgi:hypothetical protein